MDKLLNLVHYKLNHNSIVANARGRAEERRRFMSRKQHNAYSNTAEQIALEQAYAESAARGEIGRSIRASQPRMAADGLSMQQQKLLRMLGNSEMSPDNRMAIEKEARAASIAEELIAQALGL